VDVTSRNTHDLIFRTVEIGVALWFPCVLWNCIRPEQLWALNPKKILNAFGGGQASKTGTLKDDGDQQRTGVCSSTPDSLDDEDSEPVVGFECWVCYDSDKQEPMIRPCSCKGDVGAVHHDCLKRWLVESADNPDALKCRVCRAPYTVENGSQFSLLSHGFTLRHWLATAAAVAGMRGTIGGCWAVITLYPQAWVKMLAVGGGLLVQYVCLRSLGINTVTAYQRAKVSAFKIVSMNRVGRASQAVVASEAAGEEDASLTREEEESS